MSETEIYPDAADASEDKSAPVQTTSVDFDHPSALVGKVLDGRFFIEKNLSDTGADVGGIGIVYLATDTKLLGRQVVVKILNEAALQFHDIVRKFMHEKEALVRLDHPGVVRILDSGSLADGNPFIVMEYIEGHSLRKALSRQAVLPLHVVAHIIESLTDALAAAHGKKILHRDVKPENIMLTPVDGSYDRVRLIDFGIARVGESKLAPETQIQRAIGTILYMAPEQLTSVGDLTPAADIYSAATVAYEIITGELPFKPKTVVDMYKLQQEGVKRKPTTFRPDLPQEAEELLLRALQFDAEKRPQDARTFGRELARALKGNANLYYTPRSVEDDQFLHSIKTEFYPNLGDIPVILEPKPAAPPPNSLSAILPASEKAAAAHETGPASHEVTKSRAPRFALYAGASGIVLLLIVVVGAAAAWMLLPRSGMSNQNGIPPTPSIAPMVEKPLIFTYYLMVRNPGGGKPFPSSGMDLNCPKGCQFTFNFDVSQSGYLYLFNEGPDEKGVVGYTMLFPDNKRQLISQVVAGESVSTNGEVQGVPGKEIMWAVWSRDRRTDLESIVAATGKAVGGRVGADAAPTLAQLLEQHRNSGEAAPPVEQRRQVRAGGDLAVHRWEIIHH
jgi:eukaryotic-like serine/threonine-protein kinase